MIQSRRAFMASATAIALAGYAQRAQAVENGFVDGISRSEVFGYGPLVKDPYGLMDLPEGFSYRVVSQVGETMSDGLLTPNNFDGMACFPLDEDRVILVRNHETKLHQPNASAWGANHRLAEGLKREQVYGVYTEDGGDRVRAIGGGTTTIVYNLKTGKTERTHLSLGGTAVNCAGGKTPWGSWLTCEESIAGPKDGIPQEHGWVFEVPANATGMVEPKPIKAMGRFKHEAACVDPSSGAVYMTEDVADGLFYRFLPNEKQDLHKGGRLQALAIKGQPSADTRNWDSVLWQKGQTLEVEWVDLDEVESPNGDLNKRGHAKGAALFARGEGIHWAEDHLYFACTSGGVGRMGQVMRYVPSPFEGRAEEASSPARLELFVETTDQAVMEYVDNITIAPNGHVIGCEDRAKGTNHIRGIMPNGRIYTLARNPQPHDDDEANNELAGVCFSPDGQTMFVNLYAPGTTLAITGPWDSFRV
ncbi:alkaline phosphatase PhoX [uncultured Brevundimonas sp.]|uniref:alkaline phosphatase PhoX n=1 Tax=uncultured Brevundimonas sp. TaxID=213418 RepID=UPI0026209F8A|nr:alkaline phosphatase PhoX [uncultured Brevundimonas sp.]